jgi:hypothetical protein
MRRLLVLATVLLLLPACSSGPERNVVTPLPEKVTPRPYSELLDRARSLAARATEVTYVGNWDALSETARNLEQTAVYLEKAVDVPAKHADTVKTASADLRKASRDLLAASAARNTKKTDDALTRINRIVREMKLSD